MKAYVDKTKCASDNRICKPMKECPICAISRIEDEEEPLGSSMEIDHDKCGGCGICADLCCVDAVRLMKILYGIDMEQTQHPKLLDNIPPVDIVITMGCNVTCPFLPCKHREDWGLDDPTGKSDEEFISVISVIENKKYQSQGFDKLGRPFCESVNLPFLYADICKGKNRAPRMKWVCPLSVCKKGKCRTSCKSPCTQSPCGRMVYTYMDDCRLYPGAVPRGTDHWNNIYRQRTVIERTLSYCKDVYAIAHPQTQDRHTISADFFFAGITQLVTLIVADKISTNPFRSLRSLIA